MSDIATYVVPASRQGVDSMKRKLVTHLALLCTFSLLAPAIAQEHHRDATPAVAATARRWTPDAPLREGMRRVHAAVEELRH
jgi:hypothetical protein